MTPTLEIMRISLDAELPTRAYSESAAWDLPALLMTSGRRGYTKTIAPRETAMIPTGLAAKAPPGNVLLCCSRSGLASKSIFVANAPGIIDPDYRGEIKVLLYNGGIEPFYVKNGDRIAQLLVMPLTICALDEVNCFDETERGAKGFGSTGL